MRGLQATLNLSNNAATHVDAATSKATTSGARLQPPQQPQQPRKHLSTSDAPDSAHLSLPSSSHKSLASIHSGITGIRGVWRFPHGNSCNGSLRAQFLLFFCLPFRIGGGSSQLTVALVSFTTTQLAILMNDLELEGGAEIPLLYEDSAEW